MNTLRITFFFLFMGILSGYGQKTERATGTFQLRVETNMTKDQAKERARELAMIDAIQSVYKTYVDQQTQIRIQNGRESYSIIGNTKVLGEWIETFDEKFSEDIRTINENGQKSYETWITCTITGKVRQATPKAAIEYQTLNCPELHCRTVEFYEDESLYLYFESPIDGYLSVFLEDDIEVYRLFPYTRMSGEEQSTAAVKGDLGYILFSNDHEKNRFTVTADEYMLYTTKPEEINILYIVFSERNYVKPGLAGVKTIETNGQEVLLPKSLSKKEFQQWLANNRAYDPSFLAAKIILSIISP